MREGVREGMRERVTEGVREGSEGGRVREGVSEVSSTADERGARMSPNTLTFRQHELVPNSCIIKLANSWT